MADGGEVRSGQLALHCRLWQKWLLHHAMQQNSVYEFACLCAQACCSTQRIADALEQGCCYVEAYSKQRLMNDGNTLHVFVRILEKPIPCHLVFANEMESAFYLCISASPAMSSPVCLSACRCTAGLDWTACLSVRGFLPHLQPPSHRAPLDGWDSQSSPRSARKHKRTHL